MNICCHIAYDGSRYHGWEIQPNANTIKKEILNVFKKITNQKNIYINSVGRTDAFVHAYDQVINFNIEKTIDCNKFMESCNKMLPDDIKIIKCIEAKNDFHARFSCKNKTYLYRVYTGKSNNVFENNYSLCYDKKIHLQQMKKNIKKFVGKHNFLSFSISELQDTVRTINWVKIKAKHDYLYIYINGNGFLRAMVRMIIGTLFAINEQKEDSSIIDKLLNNPSKGKGIYKARASGLYLFKANY